MTQVKIKTNEKSEKNKENFNDFTSSVRQLHTTEKYIQIAAWVLFTIGLCILVSTFYIAIRQRSLNNPIDEYNTIESKSSEEEDIIYVELNKTIRAVDFNIDLLNIHGCVERYCQLFCKEADDIYESVHESLMLSNCIIQDAMLIINQSFPLGILKNSWINSNNQIKEIALINNNITKIKSGAFNNPLFSSTFMITITQMNIKKFEGGTLLGLYALKYLLINTIVDKLENAFFQPVQTTLTHLMLNCGLKIAKDQNIFNGSYLEQLKHLDLSRNNFVAPISQKMFLSTPNVKYLIIVDSRVSSIEKNAFANLAGKLQLLNLSQNFLTTVSADAIEPILSANSRAFISLSLNNWVCDCNITQLVNVVTNYRSQFIDDIYCKTPHDLYGTFIDQFNVTQDGCNGFITDNDLNLNINTTTPSTINVTDRNGRNSGEEESAAIEGDSVFKLRCLSSYEAASDTTTVEISVNASPGNTSSAGTNLIATGSGIGTTMSIPSDSKNSSIFLPVSGGNFNPELKVEVRPGSIAAVEVDSFSQWSSKGFDFKFDLPDHEFDLQLLENRSVKVTIDDYDGSKLFIIWFSDLDENFTLITFNDCVQYSNPFLITEQLTDNTTYTFCLLPDKQTYITPFNCLPMHVPAVQHRDDDIWISEDNKQFTIGMLCLIFALSAFLGAVIAYLGIKTYPDLLEGSKNVLVVRKSDKTCYVSTISEMDYLKNSSSIKKKPIDESFKKNSKNFVFAETSPIPPPLPIYGKNMERIPSVKSTATCFEENYPRNAKIHMEDEYEMPKMSENDHQCHKQCNQNTYATSPCQPPPLPKRNSSNADMMNLVPNRFSKHI